MFCAIFIFQTRSRTFYEYQQIEPSDVIAARIEEHEKSLMAKLHDLFGGE